MNNIIDENIKNLFTYNITSSLLNEYRIEKLLHNAKHKMLQSYIY